MLGMKGWVGTVLPKVLLRWMPSRLSPLVVAAVSAAAAADDDDDDGCGGGVDDDDDDDNNNDDNYDDDDDQNFDRRLLSTILDSGTRPHMPGKRAASRVERAIMLLTALKPDRMGAERARLLVAPDRPSTAKTLTDDCSALYWTQELGLTCLESGRRAASNEPSCFSRR